VRKREWSPRKFNSRDVRMRDRTGVMGPYVRAWEYKRQSGKKYVPVVTMRDDANKRDASCVSKSDTTDKCAPY
jgi:hypothetical protein